MPYEGTVDETFESTILVVDDDALNRRLLVRALKADGHRTVEAADGEEALRVLVSERPDVMLLDVLMPVLDGFGVLIAMKDLASVSQTPVVMISALDDQAAVLRCIELGAEDFLPKPADAAILRARVNAGLNKKKLHDLQRRHLHDVFARFLPESVVDQVMADGGEPRIGGQRVTGTVMFNDLRGFTTFAEAEPPELVIDVLNRYLTEMSDAVLDHGGTLVAYLGDGIMSVFGAPIESDDHADRAVAAAREMIGPRLAALNTWVREQGLSREFRMGVGLNSGTLMSGNVGSTRRLEYTVIGDATNTAARVESMTKEHGVPLLVTEAVLGYLTGPTDEWRFVDEVAPRGRVASVRLWTLDGRDETDG
jgi:adenylate cyclase